MKVWLLTIGEPLPIAPGKQRLHRAGLLAEALTKKNVDVVWWASTFQHAQKKKIFDKTTSIQVSDHLKLLCLDTRPYRRNVSLERIVSNRQIAAEFQRHALLEPTPAAIVSSYPVPELAAAGASYARARGIPSIVDVRDLWPDIWPMVLPGLLRPLANLAMTPLSRRYHGVIKAHQCITGITQEIVDWAVIKAGRPKTTFDRAFPLAYPAPSYPESALQEGRAFWKRLLGKLPEPALRLCFFGNLGARRLGLDVMIDGIRMLPEPMRSKVQLVVCGAGDGMAELQARADDLPQVIFAGWVDGPQICALASSSSLGVLPYPSDDDFIKSIPNKAIEYLAYGLPILTSLKGPVSSLINENRCGLIYREMDAVDMARVIGDLVKHPTLLPELSENASNTYNRHFLASEVYGRYADMIVELAMRSSVKSGLPIE